jgi:hypothetical protein
MTWMWLSATVVLIGAAIDAETERQQLPIAETGSRTVGPWGMWHEHEAKNRNETIFATSCWSRPLTFSPPLCRVISSTRFTAAQALEPIAGECRIRVRPLLAEPKLIRRLADLCGRTEGRAGHF